MNKKDIEALYQLSPAQQGMLFETLAAPNSGIYIEQSICPLQGNLNESAFTQAWQQVIQRHSVLRTSFVWQDRAEPLQVVLKEVPVDIDHQDLRGLTADEQQARLDAYLTADRRNGFKVTRPPLMRLALFQMADDQYQLVWTHHHILMDGWCLSLILQDFLAFYQVAAAGTPFHLDTPRPYGDYIRWLNQQDDRKAKHFWQQKLQGFVQPTPLGKPGQPTVDKGSTDFQAHLSHELSETLNHLARQHRLTPNIVIQGIWALLLSRYSGQSDVVFGTTVSGRSIDIEGAQSMIGLFMNTLPVRVRLSPDQAFWAWLQEIQTTNLELREYEATSGSLIHEVSELPTSLPLYESILVFENYQFGDDILSAAGLSLDIPQVRFIGGQTRFPLTLLVMPGAKMSFKFIYDRQRLETAAVAQMFEHLQTALNQVVSRPDPVLADLLNLIPTAEIPVVRSTSRPISEQQIPRTPVEQLVASIWKDVLGLETIGIHDNFFELGGHSLLATQLMARMRDAFQVDIPMRSLFTAPTVAGLAEMIAQSQGEAPLDSLPTIIPDPAHRDLPFPLNDVQQAYWIGRSNTLELGNVSCHGYMEFDCVDLDLDRMNRAWQQLIARHDMLRAVVLPDGQQRILQNIPAYVIDVLDLREQDAVTVEEELLRVRNELSHQVLPSDCWPLFDIRATRIDKHHLRLHVSVDMLIADARSFQILLKELAYLYENPGAVLSPLELSFRDYVLAEHALQETDVYKRSLAYWQQRLDTLPPGPELPLAIAPDSIQQPHFVRRSGKLEPATWQQLKTRAQQVGLTPSGVLLAVYAEVLTNWSKSPRFTINLTLFNRLPLHAQVNDIFGDFTSLTLLEVNNSGLHPFAERARRLQEQLWNDLDHRHVGGIRVQRELMRSQGGASRTLMPVVFTSTLTLDDNSENTTPAWLGEMVYGIGQTPQIWLDHLVSEEAGALVYNWDAVEELFPAGMLDAMFEAYSRLLVRLACDDQSWQDTLRQLTPAEQLAQRAEVNATEGPITDELLHTLFISQAAKTPDRVAVVSPSCTLTYDELLRRSNQIGRYLRQHGAQPNSVVAVVMEKGWEQIVAVMGILQAGAAYVPIDATVPVERLHYLLQHSQATLALSQSHYDLEWPDGVHHVAVDSDMFAALDDSPLDITQQPGDLAYIIFTSGSTGLPKGVVIDHRGAVNTILDMNQRFHVTAEDRVLALSALNFDLSVYDIFGLLAVGGTIVLPDAALQREPAHWAQLVERHQITLWNTVPALMNMLVEYQTSRHASLPESLRLVLMSGDWIPLSLPDRIRVLASQAELISLGGATEASIWSILYPIGDVDLSWKSIPYGKPMVNQSFEVLDDNLEPRPIWVPGSLFIGGIGLAQCYWRDDEKTNRSFIIHPQTGQRLYRTGDLGRYLPDGNIEFLGREDFQVKVQGYRIELGEIETALDQHPDIRSAVVTAVGERHADKRLVAYLVLQNEQSIDTDALRAYLKTKLPEYMVPSVFMLMDSLPLTSNGKVNRKVLPAPDTAKFDAFVAPRTEVEITLCQISAQILSATQIGIHDNFFALGGNSVQATQLVSRLRETFQIEFPVRSIFEAPSVAQLAEKIEAALWSQQRAAVPAGAEMEEGEI